MRKIMHGRKKSETYSSHETTHLTKKSTQKVPLKSEIFEASN